MPDPIVIDKCVLSDRAFWHWLRRYRGRKILPVVAFMEICFFFEARGKKTKDDVRKLLRSLDIEIEPMAQKYAEVAIDTMVANQRVFLNDWRDHSIAGHAHTPPLRVITYNVQDFEFLGARVLTPDEARQRL